MFKWDWKMGDGYPAPGTPVRGLRVFSTFACGGGSTMGYKLAGYDVLGANDIDPQMASVYRKNHHPKIFLECPIGELIQGNVPKELFDLDVLDGSPPCSTFSMAGDREKGWKTKKKFREGQATQTLSDLFFDFIDLAARLQPKVVVAENVKGMLNGAAKAYTREVMRTMDAAGYDTQLFLLDASKMGIAQKRQRVFFIGRRKDLELPRLKLQFGEREIALGEVLEACQNDGAGKLLSPAFLRWWKLTAPGNSLSKVHPKGSFFNSYKCSRNEAINTIAATVASRPTHPDAPTWLSDEAISLCGSYPRDYDYDGLEPQYLIGMSVPPVMMANVADAIAKQIFGK